MFKASRKIEYALMVLRELEISKSKDTLISAKELAEKLNLSFEVVAKVMQSLAGKSGILKVKNGAQGGYELLQPLEQVSFYQVCELIEGPMALAKCLDEDSACDISKQCQISVPMANLNSQMIQFYKTLNVKTILFSEPFSSAQSENSELRKSSDASEAANV